MKKIMVLGGTRFAIPIIKAAHELGLYVITCDYLPENVAHSYADEYCNVDITDKIKVYEEAKKRNISGIISFACDPGVVTAAYVADKLNLPSCGPYESVEILQNKGLFRAFLEKNGFNVPKSKTYTDLYKLKEEFESFTEWPVIIKPTDSAGSKGVKKANTLKELLENAQFAISFSKKREIIVEEFLQQEGYSSDTDSFSIDGELVFSSFNSQRFDLNADNKYTPAAYSWPSYYDESVVKELTEEIQRVITLLKMRTSIYNIETRVSNKKPYIMELSPRGGGNRLAECLEYSTGIDLIKNAVRAAVGIEVEPIDNKWTYNGFWAEVIVHSKEDGVFDKIEISNKISKNIYQIDLWVKEGDFIHRFSSANYAIGTIIMKFTDINDLETIMKNIDDYIKVVIK